MQYEEGSLGRVFALRFEEGERLPGVVEEFAKEHGIRSAMIVLLGGAGDGSRLVVGPEKDRGEAVIPMEFALKGNQEILAVGTIFPDEQGNPLLHMHGAAGREGEATVGCTRPGVDVWLVAEAIVLEIVGTRGLRKKDPKTGFQLLQLPGRSL
jgi:uncharacterized protein